MGRAAAPLDFGSLARHQAVPAEQLLLEKTGDALAALQTLAAPDRELIRALLTTITSGQELDVRRFAAATPGRITALATEAELDDYTYLVAGCVGEFWTRLCRAHLFPRTPMDEAQLVADGIRFGKGLQLVNILRDLPADLKNGRCYLPLETLRPAGLTPETLLLPPNANRFLPLFRSYLDLAEAHLAAGWRYTNALPFRQFRVRLACAWPLLLGFRTLARLRAADVTGLQARVKVPRGEVYTMMARTLLACPLPFLWRRLHAGPRR